MYNNQNQDQGSAQKDLQLIDRHIYTISEDKEECKEVKDHTADELISRGYKENHFSAPSPQSTLKDLEALEILGRQEKQDIGSQVVPCTLSIEENKKILEEEIVTRGNLDSFLGEEKDSQSYTYSSTKLRRNKSYRQLTSYLVDSNPAIVAEYSLEVNPRLETFIPKLKGENPQLKQAGQWTQKELEQLSLELVELQKELSCRVAYEDEFILLPTRTVEWQKLELNQLLSLPCGSVEKEDQSASSYPIEEDTNGNRELTPKFSLFSRGNSTRRSFLSQEAEAQSYILEDLIRDNSQLTAQVNELKMKNQILEQTLSETKEALGKTHQDLEKLQQLLSAGETIEKAGDTVEAGLSLCNLSEPKPLSELRNMTVKYEPIFKQEINSRGK